MEIVGETSNSWSYAKIDISTQVEIPIPIDEFDLDGRQHHFGAFGVKRKHHWHKGVDLYCPDNQTVFAVEPGVVAQIRPFTGRRAGCPWWNDTEAVSIVGRSGLVVYGEITPNFHIKVGDFVQQGQPIGWVKQVLKNDKGRPMSMLHLELHEHHRPHTGEKWSEGQKPDGLLDPTPYLLHAHPYDFEEDIWASVNLSC